MTHAADVASGGWRVIYVRTLGTAEIEAGEVRLKPSAAKKYALMLYLCAEPGRRVTRRQLHDLLFPALSEKNARHTLRELVYQLKQAGVEDLVTDDEGIAVRAEAVRSDYSEVIAAERPDVSQLRAIEGGFLPGYAPAHSETYAEWFEGFKARSSFEICRRLRNEIERSRGVADWVTAEQAARACLSLDHLNETATLTLAEAYAVTGSKAKAVELLDAYIKDVGDRDAQIQLPAAVLRKRISERGSDRYGSGAEVAFVGREAEMQTLQKAFMSARSGRSSMLLVTGEPGIGKTRLVASFIDLATLDGARVHRVAAHSHDARRPLGAFVDLLPSLLQEKGAAGCSPESLTALRRLMSRNIDVASASAAETETIWDSIEAGISDLLDAIAAEGTLIVVLEDVHWLDETSLRVVYHALRDLSSARLLVVATSRQPEVVQADDISPDRFARVVLRALTSGECSTLCERAFPESADDVGLQQWIASFSGGNPLYVLMLVDHFRATGRRFEIPTTLVEMISRRFTGLSVNAEAALTCCVALGRHSSIDRLQRSLELPHIEFYRALRELQAQALILSTDSSVIPRHPLIAEAIQSGPATPTRRLTSLRVARVLETDSDLMNDPSILWDCARQWVIAGEQTQATAALKRCADHSVNIGRPREAAEFLLQAAELAGTLSKRVGLLKDAIRAAGSASENEMVLSTVAALRQLEPIAQHDDIELLELAALAGSFHSPVDLAARINECLRCTTADSEHRVRAGITLLKYVSTRFEQPVSYVDLGDLDAHLPKVEPVLALEYKLILETHRSRHSEAITHAMQLVSHARRVGGMRAVSWLINASIALWHVGEVSQSMRIGNEANLIASAHRLYRMCVKTALLLGGTLYDLDELHAAAEWMRYAEELAQRVNKELCAFEILSVKCYAAIAENRTQDLAEMLQYAEKSGAWERNNTGRVHRCLELWLKQLGHGLPPSEADILQLYESVRCESLIAPASDMEMALTIRFFSEHGQPERAATMAASYLGRFSTIRCPLARSLRLELEANALGHLAGQNHALVSKYREEMESAPIPTEAATLLLQRA